jgi:hypothetical protein
MLMNECASFKSLWRVLRKTEQAQRGVAQNAAKHAFPIRRQFVDGRANSASAHAHAHATKTNWIFQ